MFLRDNCTTLFNTAPESIQPFMHMLHFLFFGQFIALLIVGNVSHYDSIN